MESRVHLSSGTASSSCKQLTTPTWSALMGAIASYSHVDKQRKKNAQITAKWGCQPRRKSSPVVSDFKAALF